MERFAAPPRAPWAFVPFLTLHNECNTNYILKRRKPKHATARAVLLPRRPLTYQNHYSTAQQYLSPSTSSEVENDGGHDLASAYEAGDVPGDTFAMKASVAPKSLHHGPSVSFLLASALSAIPALNEHSSSGSRSGLGSAGDASGDGSAGQTAVIQERRSLIPVDPSPCSIVHHQRDFDSTRPLLPTHQMASVLPMRYRHLKASHSDFFTYQCEAEHETANSIERMGAAENPDCLICRITCRIACYLGSDIE
eukprot:IDg6867t1